VNPELQQALVTIAFGALAGGITNAIAVWMLFHPYEPLRVFGRPVRLLQGAIPKNKARLASTIGRTVGSKLLTPEDLARTLSEPQFRSAFDAKLAEFVAGVLDRDRGSLNSLLPPEIAAELRALLRQVADGLVQRVDVYFDSDEFRDRARAWAESLAHEVTDRPLSDLLTPEREAAITTTADRWITDVVEGEGFSTAIHDYLDRAATRVLVPGKTFQEIVPGGMVSALERAIGGYLPIALEKLGGMLDDPGARERVERILHEILDRFMADLKFHQRLVAALLITPETIDRVLKAIEREGAAKISELLQDNAVRDAMARGVNNAVVDFLAKPVVDVLGQPEDKSVADAKVTIANWAISIAQDEHTRGFLVEKLRATLRSAESRTWGDIFRHIPPEHFADAIAAGLRSERATQLFHEAADKLIDRALDRPLGKFAAHMPADAPARLESAIAEPLWRWLQEQTPTVAQHIDIARRVEQKILDFPVQKVEELIKGVTERELKLIVNLGYVLGAAIGAGSALLNLVF
jgi:uncharacterized membrane protein YheB (UPF0754 family)